MSWSNKTVLALFILHKQALRLSRTGLHNLYSSKLPVPTEEDSKLAYSTLLDTCSEVENTNRLATLENYPLDPKDGSRVNGVKALLNFIYHLAHFMHKSTPSEVSDVIRLVSDLSVSPKTWSDISYYYPTVMNFFSKGNITHITEMYDHWPHILLFEDFDQYQSIVSELFAILTPLVISALDGPQLLDKVLKLRPGTLLSKLPEPVQKTINYASAKLTSTKSKEADPDETPKEQSQPVLEKGQDMLLETALKMVAIEHRKPLWETTEKELGQRFLAGLESRFNDTLQGVYKTLAENLDESHAGHYQLDKDEQGKFVISLQDITPEDSNDSREIKKVLNALYLTHTCLIQVNKYYSVRVFIELFNSISQLRALVKQLDPNLWLREYAININAFLRQTLPQFSEMLKAIYMQVEQTEIKQGLSAGAIRKALGFDYISRAYIDVCIELGAFIPELPPFWELRISYMGYQLTQLEEKKTSLDAQAVCWEALEKPVKDCVYIPLKGCPEKWLKDLKTAIASLESHPQKQKMLELVEAAITEITTYGQTPDSKSEDRQHHRLDSFITDMAFAKQQAASDNDHKITLLTERKNNCQDLQTADATQRFNDEWALMSADSAAAKNTIIAALLDKTYKDVTSTRWHQEGYRLTPLRSNQPRLITALANYLSRNTKASNSEKFKAVKQMLQQQLGPQGVKAPKPMFLPDSTHAYYKELLSEFMRVEKRLRLIPPKSFAKEQTYRPTESAPEAVTATPSSSQAAIWRLCYLYASLLKHAHTIFNTDITGQLIPNDLWLENKILRHSFSQIPTVDTDEWLRTVQLHMTYQDMRPEDGATINNIKAMLNTCLAIIQIINASDVDSFEKISDYFERVVTVLSQANGSISQVYYGAGPIMTTLSSISTLMNSGLKQPLQKLAENLPWLGSARLSQAFAIMMGLKPELTTAADNTYHHLIYLQIQYAFKTDAVNKICGHAYSFYQAVQDDKPATREPKTKPSYLRVASKLRKFEQGSDTKDLSLPAPTFLISVTTQLDDYLLGFADILVSKAVTESFKQPRPLTIPQTNRSNVKAVKLMLNSTHEISQLCKLLDGRHNTLQITRQVVRTITSLKQLLNIDLDGLAQDNITKINQFIRSILKTLHPLLLKLSLAYDSLQEICLLDPDFLSDSFNLDEALLSYQQVCRVFGVTLPEPPPYKLSRENQMLRRLVGIDKATVAAEKVRDTISDSYNHLVENNQALNAMSAADLGALKSNVTPLLTSLTEDKQEQLDKTLELHIYNANCTSRLTTRTIPNDAFPEATLKRLIADTYEFTLQDLGTLKLQRNVIQRQLATTDSQQLPTEQPAREPTSTPAGSSSSLFSGSPSSSTLRIPDPQPSAPHANSHP